MNLLLRWIIASFSLFIAAWLVPGIRVEGNAWGVYAVMAVILGLINAIIRPILKLLSLPIIILTLGLFLLVINGITLWMASALAIKVFHVGFYIDDFWSALPGALIVSIVSMMLSGFFRKTQEDKRW
jgi:putative membrane protein